MAAGGGSRPHRMRQCRGHHTGRSPNDDQAALDEHDYDDGHRAEHDHDRRAAAAAGQHDVDRGQLDHFDDGSQLDDDDECPGPDRGAHDYHAPRRHDFDRSTTHDAAHRAARYRVMLADVDWSSLTVGAAFIAGAISATLATILVFRHVLGYMKRQRDD